MTLVLPLRVLEGATPDAGCPAAAWAAVVCRSGAGPRSPLSSVPGPQDEAPSCLACRWPQRQLTRPEHRARELGRLLTARSPVAAQWKPPRAIPPDAGCTRPATDRCEGSRVSPLTRNCWGTEGPRLDAASSHPRQSARALAVPTALWSRLSRVHWWSGSAGLAAMLGVTSGGCRCGVWVGSSELGHGLRAGFAIRRYSGSRIPLLAIPSGQQCEGVETRCRVFRRASGWPWVV